MTPALRFLQALRARGVRLWAEDGQLRYDAPHGVITAEDRARVPEVKADLLRLLNEPRASGPYGADDERLSIQADSCTPDEIDAESGAKPKTAKSTEVNTPGPADAQPLWDTPGPWRWVNPDNSPEDLALLRAIDRLDCERSEPPTVWPCYGCGSRDWWRSIHGGHFICRHCHPPLPGAEAVEGPVPERAAHPKDPA